jgi:outer membrane beta-barrel protein
MRSLTWLVLAVPLAAVGQEVPGIDLSAPPEKPVPSEGKPSSQAAPPETPAKPGKATVLETALGAPGEQDAALGDRVKAVQRKGFLKRGRIEMGVLFAPTINDAFYQKYGLGGRIAYHLQDSFALGVRGAHYYAAQTDYRRQAVLAFQSLLLSSKIHDELMLDGIWSPVYGKVAFLGHSIVHFDLFLQAGVGGVWSDTSLAPQNQGAHIAADFGGGVRFYPTEFMALEAGMLATLYPDQTGNSVPATLQKVITVNLGISFFLPTRFEYVYP